MIPPSKTAPRKCPFCLTTEEVIRTTLILRTMFGWLSCGHQVAILPEEGGAQMKGEKKVCPTCGVEHETFIDGALRFFCHECKTRLNITTQAAATEMLQKLDKAVVDDRGGAQTPSQALTTTPKPDPAKLLAIARSMTAYGVLAGEELPADKGTAYVIAKSGLFEVRRNDIANIISKAKDVVGVPTDLQEGIELNVPQVPYETLMQTVAFFRAVCEKAKGASEAYLQVWWNTKEKAYHIHVPQQNVSGASVQHQGHFDAECERDEATGLAIWLHVMDIHSHGSMSAFWSGTDDNDERKAPEGRMFGVIGNVMKPMPEWKWRIRTKDGFAELDISSIFALPAEDEGVDFRVSWRNIYKTWKTAKDGVLNLVAAVDPFKGAECPKEWLDAVQTSGGGWWNRGHGHQHGHGHHQVQGGAPMLIYIRSGDQLEEFEKLPNGGTKRTSTPALDLKRKVS